MTILTKNDKAGKPGLWYPAGAGGMWLNYLIWSGQKNKTIDYDFTHFEYGHVADLEFNYQSYVNFARHLDDPAQSQIRLGSDRAWYNFYLNINIKKTYQAQDPLVHLYQTAVGTLEQSKKSIPFNLEWTLIWSDPERFINDLSEITSIRLYYNKPTQQAIKQYQQTCYLPEFNEEFCQSDLYKQWHQATIDTQTDPDLTLAQRASQAREITQSLYWPGG